MDLTRVRFTEKVLVTENSNLTVQIPDQKQIERIIADKVEELWLAGFLNDNKGKG